MIRKFLTASGKTVYIDVASASVIRKVTDTKWEVRFGEKHLVFTLDDEELEKAVNEARSDRLAKINACFMKKGKQFSYGVSQEELEDGSVLRKFGMRDFQDDYDEEYIALKEDLKRRHEGGYV